MNLYKYSLNIKLGLLLGGIILISSLLMYSQKIVNGLREDNRAIVKIYAELMASAAASTSDENIEFIFESVIKNVTFPVIQSDNEGEPVSWRNLPESVLTKEDVQDYMFVLDKQNEPIPLSFVLENRNIIFGFLHYGDSQMIGNLNRLPFFEILAVGIFIIIGFLGFNLIRNNEKRSIWVGMARETAHQLGTPVSSLMGWLEYIESQPEKVKEASEEMKVDLARLKQVSDRFSEMGSYQKKIKLDLITVIRDTIKYISKRIPGNGQKVILNANESLKFQMDGNPILLSWAFENLLKNSLDATSEDGGEVKIGLDIDDNKISIRLEDNGVGIARKDWKNVFRPGFSTKKHGWGLGLSLTKRIFEEIHGGSLTIVESTPGKGTIFLIKLTNKL